MTTSTSASSSCSLLLITPYLITDNHTYIYISYLEEGKCNYDNIKQINDNIIRHFHAISCKNYTLNQLIDKLKEVFPTPISFPIVLNDITYDEKEIILARLAPIFGYDVIPYNLSLKSVWKCADENGCF